MYKSFFVIFLTVLPNIIYSQSDNSLTDVSLIAQTKQLNQFIRRFNNLEDEKGNPKKWSDTLLYNNEIRKEFIKILFDLQNTNLQNNVKEIFIKEVTDKKSPQFIQLHKFQWFAEVNCTFIYKKKQENITLVMKLQEEKTGSKWVISNAKNQRWTNLFAEDTISSDLLFLHPMSHELEFTNMHKIFQTPENLQHYAVREYQNNFLTVFFYEIKNNDLKFETIKNVKFHFFQIQNWYFSVSFFNRTGYNSGWLIDNLKTITETEKTELLTNLLK